MLQLADECGVARVRPTPHHEESYGEDSRRRLAGLSDILLALGEELRTANHQIDTYSIFDEEGGQQVEPILFLAGASVELAISVTAPGSGGVKVWVVNTEAGLSYQQSGKITVQLNTGSGEALAVGM